MIKRHIYADFSKRTGRLHPINGVNTGPRFGLELDRDFSDEYRSMAVPAVRTHNVEYPYGGGRFVDLHNIFPDFSLDERFDLSYNFGPTDAYFAAIKGTGAQIFLRLGESTDPYEIKPYLNMTREPEKWASVAEHIIAHYNEGWGRGFKHGIKYVEIMCDIDGAIASGTDPACYFEFYRIVATRLKERFPRLKIGAYSCGGFFSLNHFNGTVEEKLYVQTLEDFLAYITANGTRAPLDFLSWKCYAETPEELSLHANYARNYLDQCGLKKTQSIVSEFNLRGCEGRDLCLLREYPSQLVASLIIAEKSDIDMMFYSDADPRSAKCALYSLQDRKNKHYYAAYHAMCAFGEIARLGGIVDTSEDFRREIYSLAASDGERGAMIIATRDYNGIIELDIKGGGFGGYSIYGFIGGGERGAGFSTKDENVELGGGKILLRAGKNEVYLVKLEK